MVSLVGEVVGETRKSLNVRVAVMEGKPVQAWIPKSLIRDGIIPAWKVKEKFGVDCDVQLVDFPKENSGSLVSTQSPNGVEKKQSEPGNSEMISELASILRQCVAEAEKIIGDIKLHISADQSAQLLEKFAIALFIAVRERVDAETEVA